MVSVNGFNLWLFPAAFIIMGVMAFTMALAPADTTDIVARLVVVAVPILEAFMPEMMYIVELALAWTLLLLPLCPLFAIATASAVTTISTIATTAYVAIVFALLAVIIFFVIFIISRAYSVALGLSCTLAGKPCPLGGSINIDVLVFEQYSWNLNRSHGNQLFQAVFRHK